MALADFAILDLAQRRSPKTEQNFTRQNTRIFVPSCSDDRAAPTLRNESRVPIAMMRPTQGSVGFEEVADKRRRYRAADRRSVFLDRIFPIVLGPEDEIFVIDGHHWLRALQEEGVQLASVDVVADLRHLDGRAFWQELTARHWCHLYDATGRRIGHDALPARIADLPDDPYRSLATAIRRAGAVQKQPGSFGEFTCAAALRRAIPERLARSDYPAALRQALTLASRLRCGDCTRCGLRSFKTSPSAVALASVSPSPTS